MKKFLVLALSVMMILSIVTVASAAAVTFGGWARYGYDWVAPVTGSNETGASDAKYKLITNLAISDSLSANITFVDGTLNGASNVVTDAAFFLYKTGSAAIKVGTFDYNVKDSVDIVPGIFGGNDLDDIRDTVLATYNFTPKVFASLYVSQAYSNSYSTLFTNNGTTAVSTIAGPVAVSGQTNIITNQGYYGASVGYAGDVFGIDAYYVTPAESDWYFDPVTAVNVYAKITPALKAYLHYGATTYKPTPGNETDYKSEVLGLAFYPGAKGVYARFEYDFAKGLTGTADGHSMGYYVGYKFANGLETQYCRQISTDTTKYYVFDGANANYANVSRLRFIANF